MNSKLTVREQQELFKVTAKKERIVNVASVPMRSPFRYAGGKTWLVPRIRQWLRKRGGANIELIEPFAGGGIVSLTAAFEELVGKVTMVELDEDVAAVWHVIINGDAEWLANRITTLKLTVENARKIIDQADKSLPDRAFATIVKNRVNRGGILADGASFIKYGEGGKGIRSRWYPDTLKRRILEIAFVSDRIQFIEADGFAVCEKNVDREDVVYFIDPPYTKAGGRLYRHSDIDHEHLFDLAMRLKGDFLMTYDNVEEVRQMAQRRGFDMRTVAMKNTHHAKMTELLIGQDLSWVKNK